jgi:group I intron endonuclease
MAMNKIPGIYAIKNKINDKMYIGSSISIEHRFYTHKLNLSKNVHGAKLLQEDWDNLGESNFEFIVLEELINPTKDQLFKKEQYYIDLYESYDTGYNYCKIASGGNGSGIKHPFYNRLVPDDTKEKISNTLTGRHLSKEHCENISKSQIGHKRITKEVREKISAKQRKLLDEEVKDILNRISYGETLISIKQIYTQVSYSTIKGIKNGCAYSHVSRK